MGAVGSGLSHGGGALWGYVDEFECSKAPPLIAKLPEFNQGNQNGLTGLQEEKNQPAPVLEGLPVQRGTEHVAPHNKDPVPAGNGVWEPSLLPVAEGSGGPLEAGPEG